MRVFMISFTCQALTGWRNKVVINSIAVDKRAVWKPMDINFLEFLNGNSCHTAQGGIPTEPPIASLAVAQVQTPLMQKILPCPSASASYPIISNGQPLVTNAPKSTNEKSQHTTTSSGYCLASTDISTSSVVRIPKANDLQSKNPSKKTIVSSTGVLNVPTCTQTSVSTGTNHQKSSPLCNYTIVKNIQIPGDSSLLKLGNFVPRNGLARKNLSDNVKQISRPSILRINNAATLPITQSHDKFYGIDSSLIPEETQTHSAPVTLDNFGDVFNNNLTYDDPNLYESSSPTPILNATNIVNKEHQTPAETYVSGNSNHSSRHENDSFGDQISPSADSALLLDAKVKKTNKRNLIMAQSITVESILDMKREKLELQKQQFELEKQKFHLWKTESQHKRISLDNIDKYLQTIAAAYEATVEK